MEKVKGKRHTHTRKRDEPFATFDKIVPEEVILSVDNWVWKEARKWARIYKVEIDDLFQEGRMGVIHAYQKYENDRGAKFLTYAALWVDHYIKRWLEKNLFTVKRTETRENRRDFWKRSGANRDLSLDLPKLNSNIDLVYKYSSQHNSEFLTFPIDPENKLINFQNRKFVWKVFEQLNLDPINKIIVINRILSDPPERMESLSTKCGITKQAINAREKKILRLFKAQYEKMKNEENKD